VARGQRTENREPRTEDRCCSIVNAAINVAFRRGLEGWVLPLKRPGLNQIVNEIAPNEAAAAGDEDGTHRWILTRTGGQGIGDEEQTTEAREHRREDRSKHNIRLRLLFYFLCPLFSLLAFTLTLPIVTITLNSPRRVSNAPRNPCSRRPMP
jgi:hypothetical protein